MKQSGETALALFRLYYTRWSPRSRMSRIVDTQTGLFARLLFGQLALTLTRVVNDHADRQANIPYMQLFYQGWGD